MRDANAQANIGIVQKLYEAYSRGDIDTVIAGLAPDVEWHSGGDASVFPAFGPRKGTAQIREFFRTVADNLVFDTFLPNTFHADEDKVFVTGQWLITMKNGGGKAKSDWVHTHTLRNGKVTKFREILDTAVIAQVYRR
jgi:ketosteroid isomerase-like protein